MKHYKLFSLLTLALILCAQAKHLSFLKNVTDLPKTSELKKEKKIPDSKEFDPENLTEKEKSYLDSLVRKGIFAENRNYGEPNQHHKKIDFKEYKKIRQNQISESLENFNQLRRLSSQNLLENIGFFGLNQKSSTNTIYATRFVLNNIKKQESSFILYPYKFTYQNEDQEEESSTNGGFFILDQTKLKNQVFKFTDISSTQIGKARGVYDIDIAILSLTYSIDGQEVDLFTEANSYCSYFVDYFKKISTCIEGKEEYLKYKNNYPSKGTMVRIGTKDILNNTLIDENTSELNFKLLVVPDYLSYNEKTINVFFTTQVINELKKFREKGGHIISSGKSGYLLELWGLIDSDTYDTSFTLNTKNSQSRLNIEGCENIIGDSPDEQSDFLKQLICLDYTKFVYLSQTYTMKKIPSDFEELIHFTNTDLSMIKKENGYDSAISDESITYPYLLVSKESVGKGRIFLVNGNPIKESNYMMNVRNIMFYAMTKNVIYDLKLNFNFPEEMKNDNDTSLDFDNLPIPGGEEGVQLLVTFKFYNLFDKKIQNLKIDILAANKVDFISPSDSVCELKTDDKYFNNSDLTKFNTSQYYECSSDLLSQMNYLEKEFKIEILDQSVTQRGNDIPLLYSIISYFDEESNKDVSLTPGTFFAQAKLAAVLRGTLNKDPSSAYPVKGKGLYFDLVLNVENKENTEAIDVKYIALIPLVSPIYSGGDEGAIAPIIPLYENYYEDHNYTYPWTDYLVNRGVDYIDYVEVSGINVAYVADYDTPVKIAKVSREDLVDKVKNLFNLTNDSKNGTDDYAGIYSKNPNLLLKQIYFADSEKFYETATGRSSLFINTATEEGAKALYGNDIPEDVKDPYHPNRAKVQYGFARVDTYFYNSIHGQYQYPNGLSDKVLISIDKFDQSSLGDKSKNKGKVLGDLKAKIITKGHYDSTKERYNRLKPNEYSNVLREYEFMTQYDPTNSEDLKKLQELSTDTIKLTHFMVPFSDTSVLDRAGSILGFKEDVDPNDSSKYLKSGYLEQYPSVKFIYAHSIDVVLQPEITRLGGTIELKLSSDVKFKNNEDPIENQRVTVSADNVAFYNTEYISNTNSIILYFKRGLMPNENYGTASKCQVYLENLNKEENITVEMKISQLKFDFSSKTFESLTLKSTEEVTAIYKAFWSLPCLYLENKLYRTNKSTKISSTKMYEYELMNPYARYGGYFQELTRHTTVWASAEAHHRSDPGFQSQYSGFSLISNIGTSSIPFAEFLTHGKLNIPGVISTSRLEWTDVWGRKWAQNLRSVYPDVPPLPPAPLNFIMTTTYELLTADDKQERLLEWVSDESVYIRVQMKIKNTYNLYWEPVICLGNQRSFIKKGYTDYRNPVFIDFESTIDESLGDNYDVNLGFYSNYGICYPKGSYLNGTLVTDEIIKGIQYMVTCSATENAEEMTKCSKKADELGLPYLKGRPDSVTDDQDNSKDKNWNYSPDIESYFPDGYISSNKMWQLTMDGDYYDDAFYKGYPFHLDDCIPNFDNGIIKPHDLVAFPIFKGLGYNITYDSKYKLKSTPYYKYEDYHGWWSDQLQNKDHSLLAGQQKVRQTSVGQESLLKDTDWIHSSKLINTNQNLIKNRIKNIYVCKYNQHRVKVTPGQKKYAFLKNVYQNNVVPVLPDLEEEDERYTNFDCSGENGYQYSIYNISDVDNRVYTSNDRDWLYFALGLRGNAKENINVILRMDPISGNKYEGVTKVQDGGRFTYWEPPDGPNSYQYYDSNVNTVIAYRVDLSINQRMFPTSLYTFDSDGYQLFSIGDEKEYQREYTMNTYMNSHGYGDATVTVYVGGTDSTKCKVDPGTFTYVKITFYNNAGFDWKMKDNGIEMIDLGYSIPLNAGQLLSDKVTAIQYPKSYNFMSYHIPEEIKDYVTLTPSQHTIDVSPQFFDLTFNNVFNIKDAFEGDYFYCLNVTENFPDKYKGKLWEIKMTLNEDYFQSLPSLNDPTGIHDYHLTIPSIKFGVPISSGEHSGKIFYVLGQARDIYFQYKIYKYFEIQGLKIVNETEIEQLSEDISDKENRFTNLANTWENITETELSKKITITESEIANDNFYKLVTVNISKAFPLLPFEQEQSPFVNNISILVKSHAKQVEVGYKNILRDSKVFFNDSRKNKNQKTDYPEYITCQSTGPWISINYENYLLKYNGTTENLIKDGDGKDASTQEIYLEDDKIFNVAVTLKNTGTETSYSNNFKIHLNKYAKIISDGNKLSDTITYELEKTNDDLIMNIKYGLNIEPSDFVKFDIVLEISFNQNTINNNRNRRQLSDTTPVELVKKAEVNSCKTQAACDEGDINSNKEEINQNLIIYCNKVTRAVGKISITSNNLGTEKSPKYQLIATITDLDSSYDINDVEYTFKRKIDGKDDRYKEIVTQSENTYIDEPFTEDELTDMTSYKVSYKVIGEFPNGRTIDSMNVDDVVFSYDFATENEKKKFPIYIIIIIVVVCLIILIILGILLYKSLKNDKKDNVMNPIPNDFKCPSSHIKMISNKKLAPGQESTERAVIPFSSGKRSIKNIKYK